MTAAFFKDGPLPYPGQGLRKLTPEMLAAEQYADQFRGFKNKVTKGIIKFIVKEWGCLSGVSHSALLLCEHLIDCIQDKHFITEDEFDGSWDQIKALISFPKNQTLADALGKSQSTIRRYYNELCQQGLIWFADGTNSARKAGQGFDMRPLCARFYELKQFVFERRMDEKSNRFIRSKITQAEVTVRKLYGLARSREEITEIQGIHTKAAALKEAARRKNPVLSELMEALMEIEAFISDFKECHSKTRGSVDGMVGQPANSANHNLYNPDSVSLNVPALREEESVSSLEDKSLPLEQPARDEINMRLPSADLIRRTLPALCAVKAVHCPDLEHTDDSTLFRMFFNHFVGHSRLNRTVAAQLEQKHGLRGAFVILTIGAWKSGIKSPAGFANSFNRTYFERKADLHASWMAMVKSCSPEKSPGEFAR